jgi:hypothetical protein
LHKLSISSPSASSNIESKINPHCSVSFEVRGKKPDIRLVDRTRVLPYETNIDRKLLLKTAETG